MVVHQVVALQAALPVVNPAAAVVLVEAVQVQAVHQQGASRVQLMQMAMVFLMALKQTTKGLLVRLWPHQAVHPVADLLVVHQVARPVVAALLVVHQVVAEHPVAVLQAVLQAVVHQVVVHQVALVAVAL